MKAVLSIAGSDSIGGAGIQADIKTLTMNGVYAMTVITALTAQNTLEVRGIEEVDPDFLRAQLDAVFEDIKPHAIKIGMLSSSKVIDVVSERLNHYRAENIVVDPVMMSSTGRAFLDESAIRRLKDKIFTMAKLITPNMPEATKLSGIGVTDDESMIRAARLISKKYNVAVLVKGGHSSGSSDDLLFDGKQLRWYRAERIDNPNTHGTGCTLSSAIAANLAKGFDINEAVERAKRFLTLSLSAMLDLGRGSGPLKHNFDLKSVFAEEK